MTSPRSPLAEELGALLEAVQEWVRAGTALPLAHDSDECRICPLCQLLGVVRTGRPETFEHLMAAGTELAAALRSAVEGSERSWRARPGRVQRIDIGD